MQKAALHLQKAAFATIIFFGNQHHDNTDMAAPIRLAFSIRER